MKLRHRQPFEPDGASQKEDDKKKDAPPEKADASPATGTAAAPPENDRLRSALGSIAEIVTEETKSLRSALGELEITLTRRIESEKVSTSAAIEAIKQDVRFRVDEMRESQQKAVEEIRKTTKESVAELKQQIDSMFEQTIDRTRGVKEGLEQLLSVKERRLEKQLTNLNDSLSRLQGDLEQQIERSGQVSSVLDSVASVLSGKPAPATSAAGPELIAPPPPKDDPEATKVQQRRRD